MTQAQQPEALRGEFFPLLNAFGEAQWQSGRGVPHADIYELGEAVYAMVERLHANNVTLQAGYDAARLEIESLKAQIEAVGAGGVERLVAPGDLWQPIETAPKDGRTLLLGYRNSHGNWRTVRGQWMSEDYIEEFWEEPDNGSPGWFEDSVEADDVPNCWPIEPTHWMPLPPAPKE